MNDYNSIESKPGIFSKEKLRTYLVYFVLYVVFCTLSLLQNNAKGDERDFHLPTAVNMNTDVFGTIFGEGYLSANTPLPYIIVILAGKLFGINLAAARLVTAVVSFLTIALFAGLLRLHARQAGTFVSFPFFFYPYYLMCSFVFYTPVYGLLFTFLALWILTDADSILSWFLFGLCSSLAVLSQQFYLVIPAAVAAWRVFLYAKNFKEAGSLNRYLTPILVMGIPFILPLWLFVKWNGLVHPNWREHSIAFHLENLTGVLVVIGLIFVPFVAVNLKRIGKNIIFITAAVSVLLGVFFSPLWSDSQGSGVFPGITFHILHYAENAVPAASVVIKSALVFSGFLLMFLLFDNLQGDWEKQIFIIAVLLIAVYSFNTLIGEKHLLGVAALLFLLVLPQLKQFLLRVYILGMSVIGSVYFVYWLFVKNI